MLESNLKQRIAAGDSIVVSYATASMTEAEIAAHLQATPSDLLFVDAQHQPVNEYELHRFCQAAARAGAPALLRIKHPDEAHMIGRYLDLGPLGIVVPQVERPETVTAAIESFYYPPRGRRSWGMGKAFGAEGREEGFTYAEWWNRTGVLMIQVESVEAVANVRQFAQPGLDMVTFGINDLTLSIQHTTEPKVRDFGQARQAVVAALEGTDVRVARANMPLGKL